MNTELRIVYGFCVSQCWGCGCMAESYRSTDFELSTTWSFLDKSWQALCSATDEEMSWAWLAICCVALHQWQPLPGLLVNPCPEQFVDTSYSNHRGSPFLNLSPRAHARKFLLSTTFSDFWDCSLSWTSYTRNWWSRLLHHKYVAPTTVFAEYHLKQFYRVASQCCSLKVICEASTISLLIAIVR